MFEQQLPTLQQKQQQQPEEPGVEQRRQSTASKASAASTADSIASTSFQSVCGSLGTAGNVRRPSSATSYSFGSISGAGGKFRHGSISSVGALGTGSSGGSSLVEVQGGGGGGDSGGSGDGCAGNNSTGTGESRAGVSTGRYGQQLYERNGGIMDTSSLFSGAGCTANSTIKSQHHHHHQQQQQQHAAVGSNKAETKEGQMTAMQAETFGNCKGNGAHPSLSNFEPVDQDEIDEISVVLTNTKTATANNKNFNTNASPSYSNNNSNNSNNNNISYSDYDPAAAQSSSPGAESAVLTSPLTPATPPPPPSLPQPLPVEQEQEHNGQLASLPPARPRLHTSPRSPLSPGKLIHPGMEIFNYDTGRPPIGERHLTPPLQSPHYSGPKVASAFDPNQAFLITRIGTPGFTTTEGKLHKPHLLKARGWEIRDVSEAIRRGSDPSINYPQRVGTGGVGGKNAAAEMALENVTEVVFGTWGKMTDIGTHSPWRRSFESSMLSATPSTSSFFSHFRTSGLHTPAPRSPALLPTSVNLRPSFDSRLSALPGPLHIPPDPAYVSLKTNPASSKSTFYSIETAPPISSNFKLSKARDAHTDAYQSEAGRIPMAQWKVPYNVNSPSTISLLNSYDSNHNQQHTHRHKTQKCKTVEVWAEDTDLRTQFFEMDRSTYTWEYRVRPKMKVPLGNTSCLSPILFANSGIHSPRIPYPPSPLTPTTPASIPSTPTSLQQSILGAGSVMGGGIEKVIKYRSECLVLVKEVDGARYIVGEYYFPKTLKSIANTSVSASSRLKRFMSSPTTPGTSTPISDHNITLPPPTLNTLDSSSVHKEKEKEKEKVHYTNIGKYQPGILLLDSRGVNKVIALNSLLITLKREKQRKIVTLNASSNGVRTRGWAYGVYDKDLVDEIEKPKGDGIKTESGMKAEERKPVDLQTSPHSSHSARDSVTLQISPEGGDGEEALEENAPTKNENDIEDYSLQGDDWEYDEVEGWKRKGPRVSFIMGNKGGVG